MPIAIVLVLTLTRSQLTALWMVRFKTIKEMVPWMSMAISETSLTMSQTVLVVQSLTKNMPQNLSLSRVWLRDNLMKIQVILILNNPAHYGLRSLRKKTALIWLPRWQRVWVRLAMTSKNAWLRYAHKCTLTLVSALLRLSISNQLQLNFEFQY